MTPPSVLVLYASKHGQTAKIAARIADDLNAAGLATTLAAARRDAPQPAEFDAVLIAASVHVGHHQREVVNYASSYHIALNVRPTAFVSVSLTAADDTDEARAATRELIDKLVEDTGWYPQSTIAVAGALQFEEYDIATRALMRLIARHHDASAETHVDTEFTDWVAVDEFSAGFAERVITHPITTHV